jgi:hypothetical protein
MRPGSIVHRRTRQALRGLSVVLMSMTPIIGCSDEPTPDSLQTLALTKSSVAEGAGIEFPPSTQGFRLTKTPDGEIHLRFEMKTSERDQFASGSGLNLQAGKRQIQHSSPLWELALPGEFYGATSSARGIERRVEVVPGTQADSGAAGGTGPTTATGSTIATGPTASTGLSPGSDAPTGPGAGLDTVRIVLSPLN